MTMKALILGLLLLLFAASVPFDTWYQQRLREEKKSSLGPADVSTCISACRSQCPRPKVKRVMGWKCLRKCRRICRTPKPTSGELRRQRKFLDNLKDLPENYCTNGIPSDRGGRKAALLAFAKGPCAPVILVPGVTATRLTIEINCERFRNSHRQVFRDCGWNSCSCDIEDEFCKEPEKEYLLWIPEVISPLSIISFFERSNMCFARMIVPTYDLTKPIDQMFVHKDGLNIRIYGFSPATNEQGKCGSRSIEDLLPMSYQTPASRGYGPIIAALKYIGYTRGITLQALPYNFYYSYRFNEAKLSWRASLEKVVKYSGKKALIVAHSLGNINTLYNLGLMTREDKQRLISGWLSVSAPFLGTPKVQKTLVAGNDEYMILNGWMGFRFWPFVLTTSNQMSIYELAAKCPFQVYDKEADWFKKVQQRWKYEEQFPKIDHKDSGLLFWPKLDDICHEQGFDGFTQECRIGFYDTRTVPAVRIGSDKYPISDTKKLLEKYKLIKATAELYEKMYDDSFLKTNPEIPVIVLFSTAFKTPVSFQFGEDYADSVNRGKFPKEEAMVNGLGDATVPTYSNLLTPLRWAVEFETKPDSHVDYKPVKFVEYCNIGFTGKNIYDVSDKSRAFEITKNDYLGLHCECLGDPKKNYMDCQHSANIGDSHVAKLVIEVAANNQPTSQTALDFLGGLTEKDIELEISGCPNIKPSIFD